MKNLIKSIAVMMKRKLIKWNRYEMQAFDRECLSVAGKIQTMKFLKRKIHTVSSTQIIPSKTIITNFFFFFLLPIETLHKEILWAVNENKADLVESILKRDKTAVNAVDEDGYTPLHRACYNNYVDIAKILLKYGANVNARTKFAWTPLHSAVRWSNAECAALVLQHGADVNAISDGSQTPLHIAAAVSNCRECAMTLMLEPECNVAALNNSEETAAVIAQRTGRSFPLFEMGHSAFTVETGLID